MHTRVPVIVAIVALSLVVVPPAASAAPAAPVAIAPAGGARVVQPVALRWAASRAANPIVASSDPAVAAVPASVLVEKPCCLDFTEAVGTFPIGTRPVTQRTTVTITATLPTGSVSTEVTVDPPA